ncbi:MFS transporter [Mycobacterium aquaticum]|uniref:Putative proline/betaine transporter n=1 Tax=Mycobacterium aquaticum TaxID=1927124 RepID=A0A1X0ACJ6_9MYCO|nr:MFS transporter [Mycobacterium aquaticum]ORA27777.1 MFS transporter [Mycobacterium aquaticum]
MDETLVSQRHGITRKTPMHAALASLAGTVVEWYDFFIYSTAAALVFGHLFFPKASPTAGLMASFATFAVGYLARPLGGVIFGHFGDRIGRKRTLVVTLSMMGGATFLIGVLPTYTSIGVWAPALLVVLRFIQGLGLGGEWGGAVLLAVEHAPSGKRGLNGSFPQIGAPVGLLLATGTFALLGGLPEDQFTAWGWRVPFLFSVVLILLGLLIRTRIAETPSFQRVKQNDEVARMPIVEVLRTQKREVLQALGMRWAENISFYVFATLLISYATKEVGFSRTTALVAVTVAGGFGIVALPFFAALSDRVGRRSVYIGGAIGVAAVIFPFFWLVQTGHPGLLCVAAVLMATPWAAMYGPQAGFFAEMFSARHRYSGMSLGSQLASTFAGGPTPLIATALMAAAGGSPWPVCVYVIATAAVTLFAAASTRETYRDDNGFSGVRSPVQARNS